MNIINDIKVKFKKTNPRHNLYAWIMLVLLTLPHLNPGYLNQFPVADILVNCLRVISSVLILVWILVIKRRISLIVVLIGVQQAYLLFITIILNGAVKDSAIAAVSIVSVVLLYDLEHDNRKIFLSSQLFCFEIIIYINLITEILFPNGLYIIPASETSMFTLYKNWFLGFYNSHTQYFLPALMIAFLYKLETGKRIRVYILTIAIFTSPVLVWAGGPIIALFGMGLVYLLFRNWTKIFNYYNYWMLHILFFVFIILLKMQNLLRWLIDGILGKWNSLVVRMTLWDKYLGFITGKFIFGHGVETSIVRQMKAETDWAYHAHNQFLEILYKGGIINLFLFAAIVIIAGKNVYRYRDTEESKIISITFLGWCLHGLVEPFMTPFLMGMFVIAYHSNVKNGAMVPEWTFTYWKGVLQNASRRIKSKEKGM